ncbi:MAG: hypothetical protein JHC95_22965 [Solirubrobacteraceae bacterium]|nr:hypothetical protein [Solirubrobacteraceae bacterium]
MTITASVLNDFWDDQIAENGRQGIFLLLVAFLCSFLFIRTSARLGRSTTWWPGSVVTDGGVHLHHLVWGICTMMAAGVLAFTLRDETPWFELCAVAFGIGMGLTIDEFALWVYLSDVYWAQQGRASIDAALYAAALMVLLVLGFDPFDYDSGAWAIIGTAVAILALSLVCFAKERVTHGLVGLIVPLVSLYAAVRLAKPTSLWARRFYGERRPRKQERAEARYAATRSDRIKDRVRDAVGGKTNAELVAEGRGPKRVSESELASSDAQLAAADEIRARADRLSDEQP